MRQHQKKSDGALTAAAAVAMSVLLEMSSTLSTPLEMSTVTSQGKERQPRRQHQEKSDGAATAAAAAAVSALLEMSSTLSTPLEMSTVSSQGNE